MPESPEVSTYPTTLDTWNTVTDKEDLVEQSDINKMKDALLEIETELGTDPAGSTTNLKTRLAVSLADSGAVQQGTSNPGSPVIGQPFYRTDTDQYLIYDGASWDVIGPSGLTIKSVTSPSAVSATSDIVLEVDKLYMVVFSLTQGSSAANLLLRFNSDSTGTSYGYANELLDMDSTAPSNLATGDEANDSIAITQSNCAVGYKIFGKFFIDTKKVNSNSAFAFGDVVYRNNTTGNYAQSNFSGVFLVNTTITDFELATGGQITGNVYLYELALV